jgi:DNA-binding CsgD family transcriptional regulator
MEIQRLSAPAPDADPIRAAIGSLIEATGTSTFEPRLFRLLRESMRCEAFNAFAHSDIRPHGTPRVVFAHSTQDRDLARRVGEIYTTRCWLKDPVNQLSKLTLSHSEGITARVAKSELRNSPYRRECYAAFDWNGYGAKLVDRFSVIKRHHGEVVGINFYRHANDGLFALRDIQMIVTSADLLFALLVKHKPATLRRNVEDERRLYRQQLKAIAPSLSQREVQVCIGIASGMTSEAIASTLGISIHTVLTYRKRAYARMGISSQIELLHLMFSSNIHDGAPDTQA